MLVINKIKTNINLRKFVNLCNYLNGLDFSTTKLLPGFFFKRTYVYYTTYDYSKHNFLTFFY